jgi:hypothetical protein
MKEAPSDFPPVAPERVLGAGRLLWLIALALAAHVGVLLIVGSPKPGTPGAHKAVPRLRLANAEDELIALNDPTLFARPHAGNPATAFWQQIPTVAHPRFDWTEAPRFLPLATNTLAVAFRQFAQTNGNPALTLQFRSATVPDPVPTPLISDLPTNTLLEIRGELAARLRLHTPELPELPLNDVLPPAKVQVLVDADGYVVSAIPVEPIAQETAARQSLAAARELRFAPASQLMLGEVWIYWHTIPTNQP